ncbi:MAG: hypothetical protein M3352_09610, partial [Bacteroidota bacterium]|nr:hypothetical protein [Bacteroidota bacterium]
IFNFDYIYFLRMVYHKKVNENNPLIGRWRIDSISTGKDTANDLTMLILAMALKDSSTNDYQFTKDSLLTFKNGNAFEGSAYHFDRSTKEFVLKDSTEERFVVNRINDSLLLLTGKDSTQIFLKKK